MPCSDGGPSYGDMMQERADLNARLLCTTLKAYMDGEPFEALPAEVLNWYEDHLRRDKARAEKKRKELDRKRLREEALSSLTPAQREALGL